MMTWNDEMMHFVRDGTEPIDTKLYFLLEGDFELVEQEEAPEEEQEEAPEEEQEAVPVLYDVIMNGPNCSAQVWIPNSIGSGYLTPAALFFSEQDDYINSDFNCAMPNMDDGQPQQRSCSNDGNRFLTFALNVDGLNNQRGEAHNFKLKFHQIPYFRNNPVTIQKGTDATEEDRLPMYIMEGENRLEVRRILFPVDEDEEEQPEPQMQQISPLQDITRGWTTKVKRAEQRHIKLG
jgi:hypothetical protein